MNTHEPPPDDLAELLHDAYAANPDPHFASGLLEQLAAELPARRARPAWRITPRSFVFGSLAAAVLVVLGVCYAPALFAGNPPTLDVVHNPAQAPEAIELLGPNANVDLIAPYLSNPDVKIATATALTLGQTGNDKARDFLVNALKTEQRPEVRTAELVALSNTRPDVKVDRRPVEEILNDPARPPEERAAAIQVISRKDFYRSLPVLVANLNDKSPLIRAQAYTAITRIIQRDYGFHANAPERDRSNVVRVIQADIARIDWSAPDVPGS